VSGALIHRWPTPLVEGRLVRRYERFVAFVKVGSEVVRAHCVNPGRMEGMVVPGARVWLSRAPSPERALQWTWELVELDGVMVGANTGLPNRLAGEVLRQGLLPGLSGFTRIIPEQRFGRGHRVDFALERGGRLELLEVKNCHLVYPDARGYFPDSRSERARGHVDALARLARKGTPTHVLFTLQRADVEALRPSGLHDPAFAAAVRRAARAGVSFRAARLLPGPEGIWFDTEVPVDLAPYDLELARVFSAGYDATSGWERKDGRVAGGSL
jgi:sugar fermentation stimulation protein A